MLRVDPGAGNASAQDPKRKKAEARADCRQRTRPPVNQMLSIGGVFPTEKGSPWTTVALFVAGCFAITGVAAFVIRRRGRRKGRPPASGSGPVQAISALVAVLGTLVAIGNQFIEERPTRESTITVRDVIPRITRSHFDRRTTDDDAWRDKPLIDRLEVGNVILLELRLTGYRGKPLAIRWGTYSLDPAVRGALLNTSGADPYCQGKSAGREQPRHSGACRRRPPDVVRPGLVGYPKSAKFEVQFRLVESNKQIQPALDARAAARHELPVRLPQ